MLIEQGLSFRMLPSIAPQMVTRRNLMFFQRVAAVKDCSVLFPHGCDA